MPSLLICGTHDVTYDAMVRAARAGNLPLVSLEGADHIDGLLSERALHAYQQLLRDVD